jgi:hypothetical protein
MGLAIRLRYTQPMLEQDKLANPFLILALLGAKGGEIMARRSESSDTEQQLIERAVLDNAERAAQEMRMDSVLRMLGGPGSDQARYVRRAQNDLLMSAALRGGGAAPFMNTGARPVVGDYGQAGKPLHLGKPGSDEVMSGFEEELEAAKTGAVRALAEMLTKEGMPLGVVINRGIKGVRNTATRATSTGADKWAQRAASSPVGGAGGQASVLPNAARAMATKPLVAAGTKKPGMLSKTLDFVGKKPRTSAALGAAGLAAAGTAGAAAYGANKGLQAGKRFMGTEQQPTLNHAGSMTIPKMTNEYGVMIHDQPLRHT